LEKKRHSKEV